MHTPGNAAENERQPESSDVTTGAQPGRRRFLTALLSAIGGFFAGRLLPRKLTQISDDLGEAYHEWSSPGGFLQDWEHQQGR